MPLQISKGEGMNSREHQRFSYSASYLCIIVFWLGVGYGSSEYFFYKFAKDRELSRAEVLLSRTIHCIAWPLIVPVYGHIVLNDSVRHAYSTTFIEGALGRIQDSLSECGLNCGEKSPNEGN